MAANSVPIFSKIADIQWAVGIVTANTTKDLTSGTIYQVFQADATNGGYLQHLRVRQLGTNVATVMRIWINNGGSTATAANNTLIDELTLTATTVSEVAALAGLVIPMNIPIPPGYKVYVTIGTAVAAGFDVTAVAGKY